jgi:hypothetical protein
VATPYIKSRKKKRGERLGDIVKDAYDDALSGIGEKLWDGVKQVIDSHFGMGIMLTAAALVIGMGIGGGSSFLLSAVTRPLSSPALATLAAGGLAGRVVLPKLLHQEIPSVAEVEERARQQAEARGLSQPAQEPGVTNELADKPAGFFAARLAQENAHDKNQSRGAA